MANFQVLKYYGCLSRVVSVQGHFRCSMKVGHFSVYIGARGAFEGTTSSISTNWSCLPTLQSLVPQHGAFVKLISASKFFTPESAKKISRKIWFIIEHSTTLFLYLCVDCSSGRSGCSCLLSLFSSSNVRFAVTSLSVCEWVEWMRRFF